MTKTPLIGISNRLARLERAHQPLGQGGCYFACSKDRAECLLHDEAQSPGGEQRVERSPVKKPDHSPFHERSHGRRTMKATMIATMK
jgi:hypothetical protein